MDNLVGTWFSPQGTRVEVTEVPEGRRVAIYLFRKSKTPMGTTIHTDPEQTRKMINELEAKGHVRSTAK
jgi:hypothetical protein